jgi:hypothetical protein
MISKKAKKIFTIITIIAGLALLLGSILPFIWI